MVIIGTGPTGLSAAMYTQPDDLSALVLKSDWIGGQGAIAYTVRNYPDFPPGDGSMLMGKQVTLPPPAGFGAELRSGKVVSIDSNKLVVTTDEYA